MLMLRRLAAVLALAAVASVLAAGVAAAHARLQSVTPANGSTQAAAPTHVVLTFNEPIGSTGTEVKVTSPGGKNVDTGEIQVVDNTVTQPVAGLVEVGKYIVEARIRSADGHPVTVSATFTITHPGPPAADQSTVTPTQAGGLAPLVVAALLLALSVSSLLVAVRRRTAAA